MVTSLYNKQLISIYIIIALINIGLTQQAKVRQLGGTSTGKASKTQLIENNYARLVYSGNKQYGPDIIDLSKPNNFAQEGVYIWKSGTDIWNVKVIGLDQQDIISDIKSEGIIEVIRDQGNVLEAVSNQNVRLNLNKYTLQDSGSVQISTSQPQIEFDFKQNPSLSRQKIYLGKQQRIPNELVFEIVKYDQQLDTNAIHFPSQERQNSNNTSKTETGGGGIKKDRNDSKLK